MAAQDALYVGGSADGFVGENAVGPASPAVADVFFENRHSIAQGMKPLTAAGMGGVLIE